MITYADFIIDFDDFVDTTKYPQAKVERFIARAAAQVDDSLDSVDEIVGNLAAHLLTMSDIAKESNNASSGSGRITSKTVQGEYSVTYAATRFESSKGRDNFSLTPYGIEYQRLINLASWGPVVV